MAQTAKTYIVRDATTGKMKEALALNSSAGAGSANALVALDAGGLINANMMPSGVGAEQVTVTAAEALSQYDLVNIYLDGATLKARKADGGTNKYIAHGFCPAAIESAAMGTVQTNGTMTGTGLTPGSDYFLSATPGAYATTPPEAGAGKISQKIGYAISDTVIVFEPEIEIEMGA